MLERFANLKLIATRSMGFDHIAIDQCNEQDVKVVNVPTYGENTVAEHAFALLGAISPNIVDAADRTRRGDGKTLGVIGTGHIGAHAAKIARGYDMEVIALEPAQRRRAARGRDHRH